MALTWQRIKPSVCCWVCKAYEHAPEWEVPDSWMPPGWRRTRRGFAGTVTICPECTKRGRPYQRHR